MLLRTTLNRTRGHHAGRDPDPCRCMDFPSTPSSEKNLPSRSPGGIPTTAHEDAIDATTHGLPTMATDKRPQIMRQRNKPVLSCTVPLIVFLVCDSNVRRSRADPDRPQFRLRQSPFDPLNRAAEPFRMRETAIRLSLRKVAQTTGGGISVKDAKAMNCLGPAWLRQIFLDGKSQPRINGVPIPPHGWIGRWMRSISPYFF